MISRGRRVFRVIGVIGWLALAIQLVLMILIDVTSAAAIAKSVLLFFSFFTIISNILVAVVATRLSVGRPVGTGTLRAAGAAAVYIAMVAIVWTIMLRGTYAVAGLGAVVDTWMHVIAPPVFVIAWAIYLPHGGLRWRDAAIWLILPLAYAAWVFGWGAVDGWYPYPFINVTSIGYGRALTAVGVLIVLFWLAGMVCVAVDRWLARRAVR